MAKTAYLKLPNKWCICGRLLALYCNTTCSTNFLGGHEEKHVSPLLPTFALQRKCSFLKVYHIIIDEKRRKIKNLKKNSTKLTFSRFDLSSPLFVLPCPILRLLITVVLVLHLVRVSCLVLEQGRQRF